MPSEKQYLERRENIASILQYLRAQGPRSRRQIADALALSWGCVSELVWLLLSQGIVLEEEVTGLRAKGRAPGVLKLNPDICFLGVDINRNGLSACICDLLGKKVSAYADTLRFGSKEELLDCVCSFVEGITAGHRNIFGMGFAMQGILDRGGRIWEFTSDPPVFIDFEKDLQPRFDIPTVIEHDPNCILYGCLDDTRERKMILRLDKGIGAAVYTNNEFMKDNLLEIGYLVVNERGQRLHDIVSLQAIENACGPDFDMEEPDSGARIFFEKMGKYLGVALGNLCNLLSLDEILICGDIAAYYPLFSPAMLAHYEKTALAVQQAKVTAVPVTDAAYGAAKMAMDRFQY